MTQPVVFRLVLGTLAVILTLFQYIIFRRWRSRLAADAASPSPVPGVGLLRRYRKWLLLAFGGLAVAFSSYLIAFAIVGRGVIPEVLVGPQRIFYFSFLSWIYGFAITLPLWLVLTAILALLSRIRKFLQLRLHAKGKLAEWAGLAARTDGEARLDAGPPQIRGILETPVSRRSLLLSVAGLAVDALPVTGSAVNLGGMVFGSREIAVFRREIQLAKLHPDLQGLRVVQLSDLHIGPLIHEEYLRVASGIVSGLAPDLIVVTGDIIDNDNRYLPVAGLFLRRLLESSRHGVVVVSGNHDFIDDGEAALAAFAAVGRASPGAKAVEMQEPKDRTVALGQGLTVLRNAMGILRRGRGQIQIVGLDYPNMAGRPQAFDRLERSKSYFQMASARMREEWPTVVLNHHPGDFVYLQNEAVDLVLSGHTHGGQILLSTDRQSPLAVASNVSSYYIDLYQENGRQLYVNRGLGHWFPMRIQCPPEITLITLV